jgi:bifunctional non-homologous end joining protein LigD
MSSNTELLIVGSKPGPAKLTKAEQLGILVIGWDDAIAGGKPSGDVAGESRRAKDNTFSARMVAPQLALAGEMPSGDDWLYEIKWDGYRCVATIKDGQVSMQSRSGRSEYAEQFPKVAAALSLLPNCILDGELIVEDAAGATSFETAHTAATGTERYMVFDALEIEDGDVRGAPLFLRREGLKSIIDDTHGDYLRISPAVDDGEKLMEFVKEKGLEGIVAKRSSSRYVEGTRTDVWIKVKVRLEQEFVVLGWKPGEGAKSGAAGSLLLGVRQGDPKLPPIWKACGRVGTGRDFEFWTQFQDLPDAPPGVDYDLSNSTTADLNGIHMVDPKACVVQVRFQRWTRDGRLWHPSLVGLRTDKAAIDVVRET